MKIVGQMLVRNEVDVIEEAVTEALRWVYALVVLDGSSDDGTTEVLNRMAKEFQTDEGPKLMVVSRPDPGDKFADHFRNELGRLSGLFEPGWIISFDADEIYDPNPITPVEAIQAAEKVGANVVRCHVPQFWLTFEDIRQGALHEDQAVSVQTRRRWYSWGHMGTFIWRWNPEHYYPRDMPKRTPEIPGRVWREWQRAGPLNPVCKHYCIRSLEQGLKRAEERRKRGGRQYFGKYFETWIIDEKLAGLHYRPLGDMTWCTTENHRLLQVAMSPKKKG